MMDSLLARDKETGQVASSLAFDCDTGTIFSLKMSHRGGEISVLSELGLSKLSALQNGESFFGRFETVDKQDDYVLRLMRSRGTLLVERGIQIVPHGVGLFVMYKNLSDLPLQLVDADVPMFLSSPCGLPGERPHLLFKAENYSPLEPGTLNAIAPPAEIPPHLRFDNGKVIEPNMNFAFWGTSDFAAILWDHSQLGGVLRLHEQANLLVRTSLDSAGRLVFALAPYSFFNLGEKEDLEWAWKLEFYDPEDDGFKDTLRKIIEPAEKSGD